MASDSKKTLQPIIIKRIKKGGHAAHGGAWKIAYADFVTAMMAFFLLMWLLGSTATGDLQGIASYFQTPLKVALQGGSGSGSSTSIVPGGGEGARPRAVPCLGAEPPRWWVTSRGGLGRASSVVGHVSRRLGPSLLGRGYDRPAHEPPSSGGSPPLALR